MEKINHTLKITLLLVVLGFCSCTNYHYHDGGLANGKFEGSLWEYLHSRSYDWDSTVIMIEHAGMKDYFDGTLYGEVTFFGVTNQSIARYILDHDSDTAVIRKGEQWNEVRGMDAAECAHMLKQLIIPNQRMMMEDFPRGRWDQAIGENNSIYYIATGGKEIECVEGKLFCWTYQDDYNQVPEKGAVHLHFIPVGQVYAGEQIASSNIETDNGVVHSLSYDFRLDRIK